MKPCTFHPQPSKFFFKITRSEKVSYIFSKESFSYISENETLHFSTQALKIKKTHAERISYVSRNGNAEKSSYIFLKRSYSYVSGNFLYFRK